MSDSLLKKGAGVKTLSVYKTFWKGLRSNRLAFFYTILMLIVTSTISIFIPIYYKTFFDILTTVADKQQAGALLLQTILVILILNFFVWLAFRTGTFTHNYFQSYSMARLRQDAFNHMINHSYTFFANNFTGSMVQRVSRFARAFERLTDELIWNIIPLTIGIIGTCVVLWSVSPIITLVIFVWITVFLLFNYFFSKWKLKYNIQVADMDSKTTGFLADDITNHNTIQLFTAVGYEQTGYKKVTNEQARISNFAWNLNGIVDAVQASLIFIAEFFLFYFSIKFWQQDLITVGSFVLIQAYFIGLGTKLWGFSRIVRNLYEGFADAKEMVEIMDLPHEIKDLPNAATLKVKSGEIEFKDLEFSFNKTRSVLDKINLKINGGEKVALIGPSGAGKSTFVRLILRLYNPTSGEILIDNQSILHVTQESLRNAISLVPQDPVLFHRSLRDNISYGKRDATEAEIIEAAKLAHCHEFIKDLPKGYDTYVGERGIKLSGGERQRVAIARAILKNAPILILDEATSSLDSESEALIQDALNNLMRNKTVIVIAHRLSTIRKMDRIVVIDEGKIREQGTHAELLENKESLYQKLWNLQAGGFLQEAETG